MLEILGSDNSAVCNLFAAALAIAGILLGVLAILHKQEELEYIRIASELGPSMAFSTKAIEEHRKSTAASFSQKSQRDMLWSMGLLLPFAVRIVVAGLFRGKCPTLVGFLDILVLCTTFGMLLWLWRGYSRSNKVGKQDLEQLLVVRPPSAKPNGGANPPWRRCMELHSRRQDGSPFS